MNGLEWLDIGSVSIVSVNAPRFISFHKEMVGCIWVMVFRRSKYQNASHVKHKQMEIIRQHEWEFVYRKYHSSLFKCKHCPVEKYKGSTVIEFFINGSYSKTEPPCITRTKQPDINPSNSTALSTPQSGTPGGEDAS
jgi:hypothetical protein